MANNPLGHKAYDHIFHLPGSRTGLNDHLCTPEQAYIATTHVRDENDVVIVQEKLDGSNVAVAKINEQIIPLTRTGNRAENSKYKQHHIFASWVLSPERWRRFNALLKDGERLCGEWLLQAHGTRYHLPHEPFVAFDLMTGMTRTSWQELKRRVLEFEFVTPNTVSEGPPLNVEKAMRLLEVSGHGAIDPVEGAIWRVERVLTETTRDYDHSNMIVDFLVKYVRSDKVDGCYLPAGSGSKPVYNAIETP